MFILSALLQATIVSIVVIVVLLIPILFILGKLKNKDKVSLKGVKTVVFNLNELVEDYMISTISLNKALSHETVLKALENLVNDKRIEKILIIFNYYIMITCQPIMFLKLQNACSTL